ncbi:MAG: NAD(P)/FAD-dependent oxidoreductase [Beutenbergiaceae bacterium]
MNARIIQGPGRVVVVGAGLAGLRTVDELRHQGYQGELVWLGNEGLHPYDRPPLSSELMTKPDPVWLAQDLSIDLDALDVTIDLEDAATALLLDDQQVVGLRTESGQIDADAVVVATGATPRRPWAEVAYLHHLRDADRIRTSIGPGRHLAIIGAGWIGAELASVGAEAGCTVTVLESGPAPLAQHIGVDAGERTRPWYETAGIALRTDAEVTTATATSVRFANGTGLDADLVVAAVGIQPHTRWLAKTVPLLPTGQIATDRGGATDIAGLWAVGDVARRESVHFGPINGGHWFSALRDPALLATQFLGRPLPANEPAPEVFSDQFGHHLAMLGRLTRPGEPGAAVMMREDQRGGWTQLHTVGNYLVGAIVVDRPNDASAARKLLRGASLLQIDLAAAADSTHPLRSIVAS